LDYLLFIILSFVILNFFLLIIIFWQSPKKDFERLKQQLKLIEKDNERIEKMVREEMAQNRKETNNLSQMNREEIKNAITNFSQSNITNISQMTTQQKNLLDAYSTKIKELTDMNEQKLEKIRNVVEEKLESLRNDNNKKLEEMRSTVDEKLNDTLQKRLGESFKQVSEQLEQVYKGLGEMQSLATGVGDLKKVLTNVKTRGILGEFQLENILEQIFSPEQYEKNVQIKKGTKEKVEFAIKLPGKDDEKKGVLLPIDAKFPLEDYQRLLTAQEIGDIGQVGEATKQLESRIKLEAKTIKEKYLNPPVTTDFALMYLPIEGLYAEVMRINGLWELLQREYQVVIAGPTTITAFLNSLQMGFRTLAIQKRSSEVWKLLGTVKGEFSRFGDILAKTKQKLEEATKTIDNAEVRSRQIEKKLRNVEVLNVTEISQIIDEGENE